MLVIPNLFLKNKFKIKILACSQIIFLEGPSKENVLTTVKIYFIEIARNNNASLKHPLGQQLILIKILGSVDK
jgi:hypothetical protein